MACDVEGVVVCVEVLTELWCVDRVVVCVEGVVEVF